MRWTSKSSQTSSIFLKNIVSAASHQPRCCRQSWFDACPPWEGAKACGVRCSSWPRFWVERWPTWPSRWSPKKRSTPPFWSAKIWPKCSRRFIRNWNQKFGKMWNWQRCPSKIFFVSVSPKWAYLHWYPVTRGILKWLLLQPRSELSISLYIQLSWLIERLVMASCGKCLSLL